MCFKWYPKYMQLRAHQLFAFVKISRNLNYIHHSLLSSDVWYNLRYKIHLMHQCFIKNDPHITIYEWPIDARPGGSWPVVTHKGHIMKVMLLLQGFYVDFLYLFYQATSTFWRRKLYQGFIRGPILIWVTDSVHRLCIKLPPLTRSWFPC